MTIRKYAQDCGHTIVGKLRRIEDFVDRSVVDNEEIGRCKVYIDDAGHEYWIDAKRNTLCIVKNEGGVI